MPEEPAPPRRSSPASGAGWGRAKHGRGKSSARPSDWLRKGGGSGGGGVPPQAAPDRIERLERAQVAPGPGGVHPLGLIEEVEVKRQMKSIFKKPVPRQRLHGEPEVPEGNVVVVGGEGDEGVGAPIAFQVVGLRRQ